MASLSVKLSFALLLILGIAQLGTCLTCYSCMYLDASKLKSNIQNVFNPRMSNDKKCGDPFDQTGLEVATCLADFECAKITITNEDGDNAGFIRDCLPTWICDNFANCDTCDENNCNSSSSLVPSFVVMSIFGLLSFRYMF